LLLYLLLCEKSIIIIQTNCKYANIMFMSQTQTSNGTISKSIYFINPFAFIKAAFSLCRLHHLSFFKSLLHKDFLINFFMVVFVENIY